MIEVGRGIRIDEGRIEWTFVRASGPGGQKVNKTSTAAQLRFDLAGSALPETVRRRLERLAGRRLTGRGVLVIDARRHRTQEANRRDALARLIALVRSAARPPAPRTPTQPTLASRQRRTRHKRHRAGLKRLRAAPQDED